MWRAWKDIAFVTSVFVAASCSDDSARNGSTGDGGAGESDSETDHGTDSSTDVDGDAGAECDSAEDAWCNGCLDSIGNRVRLTGRVLGPGGLFPVPRALVAAYKSLESVPEIPDEAYCEECIDVTGITAVQTAPDGSFCLDLTPGQTIYLTIHKGQFRRVREYAVSGAAGDDIAIEQELITLPSTRDDELGDMIPNIAVVLGEYDAIEDVFGKAGIGEVNDKFAWVRGSEKNEYRYHIYDGSKEFDLINKPYGEGGPKKLLEDLERMRQYHILFFSCTGGSIYDFVQNNQTAKQNLRDYVWSGGKVYVSDYAYLVADAPWDDLLDFTNPFNNHTDCDTNNTSCNHGPLFNSPGTINDDPLKEWLSLIMEDKGDALDELELLDNFNTIEAVGEGVVGYDESGEIDVVDSPQTLVEGPWKYAEDNWPFEKFDDEAPHPLTVTWPYNCGRVIFTTYHTVGATDGGKHQGLLEQEMILYYLIMEIGVCQSDVPVVV